MLDMRAFVSICIAYGIAMALVWTLDLSDGARLAVTFIGAGIVAIAAVYLNSSDDD